MRISVWSSDVCSSDLQGGQFAIGKLQRHIIQCREMAKLLMYVANFYTHGQCSPALDAHAVLCVRHSTHDFSGSVIRSEERRVGKEWAVRVDHGGRRTIKKTKKKTIATYHAFKR